MLMEHSQSAPYCALQIGLQIAASDCCTAEQHTAAVVSRLQPPLLQQHLLSTDSHTWCRAAKESDCMIHKIQLIHKSGDSPYGISSVCSSPCLRLQKTLLPIHLFYWHWELR